MQGHNLLPDAKLRIAVIDDEEPIHLGLRAMLEKLGHQAQFFFKTEVFLDSAKPEEFDCILLDIWFNGQMKGLELLRHFHRQSISAQVIVMSDFGDIDSAFEAGKLGVKAFLSKPFNGHRLCEALREIMVPIRAEVLNNPGLLDISNWKILLNNAEKLLSQDSFLKLESLTPAEAKVFLILAREDLRTKILADRLGIGVRTAETHRGNVFRKIGVRSALQLHELLEKILKT